MGGVPTFIVFISGVLLSQSFRYFPRLSLLILLAILVYLVARKPFRDVVIWLILLIGSLLYGIYRSEEINLNNVQGESLLIKYYVSEGLTDSEFLYKGKIRHIENKELQGLTNMDVLLVSRIELKEDKLYTISARLSPEKSHKNPGSFRDNRVKLQLLKVIGFEEAGNPLSRWINKKRIGLTEYLRRHFRNGGFLASIITGDRSGLGEKTKDSFSRTGLAHIISISGTHFGLLSTFVFFIIRSLIRLLPPFIIRRLTIYLSPSQISALLTLPFLILYLLISGGSIPAIRSFIMINLFLFGLLMGRKGYWLNSLLFAAFLILLWNPSSIKNLSFQLSFLAVVFIGLSLHNETESPDKKRTPRPYLKKSLRISLFVWFGTTPLVAYCFHYISLLSPLVNITITPVVCLILLPVTLFASFVYIFTGYFPLESTIGFLTDLILGIIDYLSSLSFSAIPIANFPAALIIILYGFSIAFIVGPSLSSQARTDWKFLLPFGFACLFIIIYPRIGKDLSITFLDVGQGDCAVLETYGRTFIIDTGKTGKELESYLRFRGKNTVDAIILTHADNDHSGGFQRILKNFKVREIWDNGLLLYPEGLGIPIKNLVRGVAIKSEGIEILVMHPYKGFYSTLDRDGNEHSLVLTIKGGKGNSLLLTGDIEEEAEYDLLHLGKWLKSDVIKISHHGGRHSTSEDFLNAVSPGMAIISVGRSNPFGHPHDEVIERLERRGIIIYRTDRDGAIRLTEGEKGFKVKTYDDFILKEDISLKSELRNLKMLFEVW